MDLSAGSLLASQVDPEEKGDVPPAAPSGGNEAAAPRPVADPNSADYVIGIEDVIQITVWKNADLSVTVPVRPDGKISLPLIDDVQAAGLHPLELKGELTRRWKSFLSAPEVSVIVKEVNSFKIFMVGQVVRQGELQLKGPTRLLQAISLAGGLTTFADKSKIVVLRESGGVESRREINFKNVVSGKRPEENILLLPGDTVVVP
jgi:polysaccharide export outer membrane protein